MSPAEWWVHAWSLFHAKALHAPPGTNARRWFRAGAHCGVALNRRAAERARAELALLRWDQTGIVGELVRARRAELSAIGSCPNANLLSWTDLPCELCGASHGPRARASNEARSTTTDEVWERNESGERVGLARCTCDAGLHGDLPHAHFCPAHPSRA